MRRALLPPLVEVKVGCGKFSPLVPPGRPAENSADATHTSTMQQVGFSPIESLRRIQTLLWRQGGKAILFPGLFPGHRRATPPFCPMLGRVSEIFPAHTKCPTHSSTSTSSTPARQQYHDSTRAPAPARARAAQADAPSLGHIKRHTPALALWFASQTRGSLSLLLVVLLVLFGFFGLLHREIQCPIEESNRVFLLCTARFTV